MFHYPKAGVKFAGQGDLFVSHKMCADKPKTQKRTNAQAFLCISHRKGERIKRINNTTTQLIRTFLVAECRKHSHNTLSTKKNYLSLTNVIINNLFSTFIQVNSLASPSAQSIRVSQVSNKSVSVDKSFLGQMNLPDDGNDLVRKYQSITVYSALERGVSFLTLSPFDFYRTNPFAYSSNNSYGEIVGECSPCLESGVGGSARILKNASPSFNCESCSEKSKSVKFERSSFTRCQVKVEEVGLVGNSYAT